MRRGLAEECGLDEGAPLGYPAIWNPASIRRGVWSGRKGPARPPRAFDPRSIATPISRAKT
jgi:hypothetical protein